MRQMGDQKPWVNNQQIINVDLIFQFFLGKMHLQIKSSPTKISQSTTQQIFNGQLYNKELHGRSNTAVVCIFTLSVLTQVHIGIHSLSTLVVAEHTRTGEVLGLDIIAIDIQKIMSKRDRTSQAINQSSLFSIIQAQRKKFQISEHIDQFLRIILLEFRFF